MKNIIIILEILDDFESLGSLVSAQKSSRIRTINSLNQPFHLLPHLTKLLSSIFCFILMSFSLYDSINYEIEKFLYYIFK